MASSLAGLRTPQKIVITLENIKKEAAAAEKKKKSAASVYLSYLKDDAYTSLRKDLVKLYVPAQRKEPLVSYTMTYDSFGEGVEPIYFWLLDFMQDPAPGGLGMAVSKSKEGYEASASSPYFGEMGQRATLMQRQAMEYLGAINTVIKSILNLIYDLKDFEIRLHLYDKYHSTKRPEHIAADMALKAVWLDNVDARKGLGSITQLAQRLNFATIRDLFFKVRRVEDVDALQPINERVKRILRGRVVEFYEWVLFSEKELRNRYAVEKAYLRSQVGTLKLYVSWVRPYLKAAQKLRMKEFNMPQLVNLFSNVQMELGIYGKKAYDAGKIHEDFKKLKLKKWYAIIDVDLMFRTMPQTHQTQQGRQYVQGGRTDIVFRGYALDDDAQQAFDSYELYEDMELLDQWVGASLEALYEDLDVFLGERDVKDDVPEKRVTKENWLQSLKKPFALVSHGFVEAVAPLRDIFTFTQDPSLYASKLVQEEAKKNAENLTFLLYDVYKKTHGMLTLE